MWEWDRAIVQPLALAAFERSMDEQREKGRRSREPSSREERDWRADLERGEETLRRYFEWAPSVDLFDPIRVDTEYEVDVPDPERPGADLVAPDGSPVRLRGRVDLLVEDRSGGYWLVEHRIDEACWQERDQLLLDERAVTDCWAWENFFLGMKIAGSIANEVRPAGPDGLFRRTHVGRSGFELAQAGSRLALEVQDMTNPGLRTYPNPSPGNCARCAFVPPCLALNEGADVASIVEAFYRRRTHSASEEPRIGRSTWAMSRGATLRKHRQDGSS